MNFTDLPILMRVHDDMRARCSGKEMRDVSEHSNLASIMHVSCGHACPSLEPRNEKFTHMSVDDHARQGYTEEPEAYVHNHTTSGSPNGSCCRPGIGRLHHRAWVGHIIFFVCESARSKSHGLSHSHMCMLCMCLWYATSLSASWSCYRVSTIQAELQRYVVHDPHIVSLFLSYMWREGKREGFCAWSLRSALSLWIFRA